MKALLAIVAGLLGVAYAVRPALRASQGATAGGWGESPGDERLGAQAAAIRAWSIAAGEMARTALGSEREDDGGGGGT